MSPSNHNSGAGPILLVCRCHEVSGLATSKFCPNCGMPRAHHNAAVNDAGAPSLSQQLKSPLNELSLTSPPLDSTDAGYVSPPVVIAAGNWTPANDDNATHADTAIDAALNPVQGVQWRANQPFNLRGVILSATTAFTAFTFLYFAASKTFVGAGDNTGRVNTPSALVAAEAQTSVTQPAMAQAQTNATVPGVARTSGNGAPVTNVAQPRVARSQDRSTPVPSLPSVESAQEELAPASIESLPRIRRNVAAATAPVPVDNFASVARTENFAASSNGSPLRALPSRPTYVAVTPDGGAPDALNTGSDAGSSGGRYAGTNGYLMVNGRVVVDGTAPLVTIQSPNPNGNYVGYFPTLQGAANSPAGVGAVELEIERVASAGTRATYWDGQDWAPRATRLATTVSNNVWRFTGALPDDDKLIAGYYRVKVYAQGFRGPERKTAPSATQRIRVFPKGPPV